MTDEICIYDMTNYTAMHGYIRKCLREADVPIFRMLNRMVHTYRWELPSDADKQIKRPADSLVVEDVDDFRFLQYILEHCNFQKFDVRKKGFVDYAPSPTLARHFLDRKDDWRLRPLVGVIGTPTLREDGSLLDTEGYDPASGLYLDLGGVKYPEIKDKPTKGDALKALALLKTPFEEFPFITKTNDDFETVCPSLSVALSAILTGLIRRNMKAAPLHAFDAPDAGSGKGLCCNIVTIIVVGTTATAVNYSNTDTEFGKLLFSALLANDQVIVLDNIMRPLEGSTLNRALTEEVIGDRILGVSKNAKVQTNTLFMANGNNLTVKGDTHRRIIGARIEAGERPEERTFKRPGQVLLKYVKDNRPALVAAGLAILRAYEAAGRPLPSPPLPEFGSYDQWSARVRNALVWLGEADPCLTRERFVANEPEIERLDTMLRAVYDALPNVWFTSADLAKKIEGGMASDAPLWTAINDAEVNTDAKAIGQYLRKNEGKTLDGLKLAMGYDSHTKVRTFKVAKAN